MPSSILVDSSNTFGMEVDGVHGSEALQLLSQDVVFPIGIPLKSMFDKIMELLDVQRPPVFTEEQCGDAGVQFTIKMDVRNLPSITGRRIWLAIVEGETMVNRDDAKASAVKKAFQLLESYHKIRILDFSSMVAQRVEGDNRHEVLSEAVAALDKVLANWDVAVTICEKFVGKLEDKQADDNMYAPRTSRGRVYGFLSDYLCDQLNTFYHRTNQAKIGLNEARTELARYQLILEEKGNNLTTQEFRDVTLPPTYILQCVMGFFGLGIPKYVSTNDGNGFVKSKVTLEFPLMKNFRLSGTIELEGQSYTSHQACEEAALVALQTIEENFNTKVVDYNYNMRNKALKEQKKILTKLSKILDIADSVKMMFGELITAVDGQRLQFSLEPSMFFAGPMSSGQIDAFHFCYRGIVGLGKDLAKCDAACSDEFEVLNKITWKFIVLEGNVSV